MACKRYQKISKRLKHLSRGRSGTIKTSKPHDQTGELAEEDSTITGTVSRKYVGPHLGIDSRLTISAQLAV